MCNILELSGVFVCLGRLVKFSVPGGTEKIAGLWFARRGSVPRLTYVFMTEYNYYGIM